MDTEKSRYYPNEFDWWELPEICKKCQHPMHIKSGQDFPFCANCLLDNTTAKRARELLNRIKELDAQPKKKKNPDEPHGPFSFGMPA
jgi:hypothetical protein